MRRDTTDAHAARTGAFVGVVGLAVLAASPMAHATPSDAYTWSAELVAVNEAATTATVQARIVSHAERVDVSNFSAGDQILLTWSGVQSLAKGVRNLTHGAVVDEAHRFTMPVEFVSFALDNRYVRFTVPVPNGDFENIKDLTPGKWITATTLHEPADGAAAIRTIRPYVWTETGE